MIGNVILQARGLSKFYTPAKDAKICVFEAIDFEVSLGDTVAILGKSGAGKSTLLHVLGTLEKPTAGRLEIDGESVLGWGDTKLSRFRNHKLGFVFQFHYLMNEFSAIENVMIPALIARTPEKIAKEKAFELLAKVGLRDRVNHMPGQLSGGEQQRVAIARSLILDPRILLTDEMTGNLDPVTGAHVFELVSQIQKEKHMALMSVTHDEKLAQYYQRIYRLESGKLVPVLKGAREKS